MSIKQSLAVACLLLCALDLVSASGSALVTSPLVFWSNQKYFSTDLQSNQALNILRRADTADVFTALVGASGVNFGDGTSARHTTANKWVVGGLEAPRAIVIGILPEVRTDTFMQNVESFGQLHAAASKASSLALPYVLESPKNWRALVNELGANVVDLRSADDFTATSLVPGVTNVIVVVLPGSYRAADTALATLVASVERSVDGDVVGVLAAEASPSLPYTMEWRRSFASRGAAFGYVSLATNTTNSSVCGITNTTTNATNCTLSNTTMLVYVPIRWTPGIWAGLLIVLVIFTIMLIAACCLFNIQSQAAYELPGKAGSSQAAAQ